MPKVQADFAKIQSSSEMLPPGLYRGVLFEIESKKAGDNNLDQFVFKTRVTSPEDHKDREIWDFTFMETKKHEPNKMGLGRLKAYAEAILGDEKANDTSGIDTDELIGGTVDLVYTHSTYTKSPEKGGGQGTRGEVSKVLRPS